MRIVFRLIEFAGGVYSPITKHVQATEAYQYIFDSALMLLAVVTVHWPHPGSILTGKDAEPPYGKAKRAIKKAQKVERRRVNDLKKQAKRALKAQRVEPGQDQADIEMGPYAKLSEYAD